MNATDPDRRHLHDLEDELARMTVRAEKADALFDQAFQLAQRYQKENHKLRAELAAHRAEAERPIVLLSRRVVDAHEGVRNSTEYGQWRAMDALGQAISDLEDALPDGSPVPEIGGGA